MSALIQGSYQREQNKATQKENERLNSQTWSAMAQRLNLVNAQRGLLRQQTGTDLLTINKEANRAAGVSVANAAAAGVEGASVDEVVMDVNRQNQESQATTRQNEQTQEVNLDTSVEDIVSSAVANQRYSVKNGSELQMWGTAIGATIGGFLDKYIGNSMSYGNTQPANNGTTGQSRTANASSSNTNSTANSGSGVLSWFGFGK